MNCNTQNAKIAAITEKTLVVGIDIGSETHYARAFDWRGYEYSKKPFMFNNDDEGFEAFQIWIECKSQVRMDRREINKEEVGQMNNHCAWFEKEYKDAKVCRVMIIPTIQVSYQADFTHDVKVLNNEKMDVLRNNIRCFFKEFRDYSIAELDDRYVNECLKEHSLDDQSVFDNYYEKVKAL